MRLLSQNFLIASSNSSHKDEIFIASTWADIYYLNLKPGRLDILRIN
jgi:hypothetical protein